MPQGVGQPGPPNGKGQFDHQTIDQLNEQAYNQYKNETLVQCQHCFRRFNETSIKTHQRLCTAERPFKQAPRQAKQGSSKQIPQQQPVKPKPKPQIRQ